MEKMVMKKLFPGLVALFVSVLVFGTLPARATELSLPLDTVFSGDTPAGSPPWLTATFNDGGSAGTVLLTMSATNLTGSEFVDKWYFNLDPTLNSTQLTFTPVSGTGATVTTGTDFAQADGDGKYDILFDFAEAPPSSRFGEGASSVYSISGISTLTADSFDFFSAPGGGEGTFTSAAHIQAIPLDDLLDESEGSGWIGSGEAKEVPEPGITALLGCGMIGVFFIGRKFSMANR